MRILITGGSSDIASAIVEDRVKKGDTVVFTASTAESLERTLSQYAALGPSVAGFVFDFACPEESLEALTPFLNDGIDALILNAFERVPTLRKFHEIETTVASSYVGRQIDGNFWLLHAVLKCMTERKFGRLILISSVSAAIGTSNYGVYCAAKAALEGLFLNLAVDYGAEDILSNVLRLGVFRTRRTRVFWRQPEYVDKINRLIPQGKMGSPSQVCELIGPLLSRTSYVNGATIAVSGGLPLTPFV